MMEEIHTAPLTGVAVENKHRRDSMPLLEEERIIIDTLQGPLHVYRQGSPTNPAIITYHDVAQTHSTCFRSFVNYGPSRDIFVNFCVYHVEAPGNEEHENVGSKRGLSLDDLADQLRQVAGFFKLEHTLGLGVGAGANVLIRFALKYPANVRGLFLIDPVTWTAGWGEWGQWKAMTMHIGWFGLSAHSADQIAVKFHGEGGRARIPELFKVAIDSLLTMRPSVSDFIDAYVARDSLDARLAELKCRVCILGGKLSTQADGVNDANAHANRKLSSFQLVDHCGGHVHLERPDVVARSLRLFLEGLGLGVKMTLELDHLRD